jgi:hypothetical protein
VVNLDYNSCRGVGKHSTFLTHEGWVEAGSLTIGDQILSLDGTFGDVESISISNDPQVMYNLTVDISHTFAVGEGQWVVHNTNKVCEGQGGRYGDLHPYSKNDNMEVHHMPQKTSLSEYGVTIADGGSIVLPRRFHHMTRTYGYRGVQTLANEVGLSFNDRLYLDITDLRDLASGQNLVESYYDNGIKEVVAYWKQYWTNVGRLDMVTLIDNDPRFELWK